MHDDQNLFEHGSKVFSSQWIKGLKIPFEKQIYASSSGNLHYHILLLSKNVKQIVPKCDSVLGP